jgi:hypothetical protein
MSHRKLAVVVLLAMAVLVGLVLLIVMGRSSPERRLASSGGPAPLAGVGAVRRLRRTVPLPRFVPRDAAPPESPVRVHEGQARVAEWADAMEQNVGMSIAQDMKRFDLESTETSLDCRATTCRIAWTFKQDDADRAVRLGAANPVALVLTKSAHIGLTEYDVPLPAGRSPARGPDPTVWRDAGGVYHKEMILTFPPDINDYDAYVNWRQQARE